MKWYLLVVGLIMAIVTFVSAVRGQECNDLDVLHIEFINATSNTAELIQVTPGECINENSYQTCNAGAWETVVCAEDQVCKSHPVEMQMFDGDFMTEEFKVISSDGNHSTPVESNVGLYIWTFFGIVIAVSIFIGVIA
jgi:hypothetical protein